MMCMNASGRYPTKKALKAGAIGKHVYDVAFETSLFGPEAKPGSKVVCTNHPKRSWFAELALDADCKVLKVS